MAFNKNDSKIIEHLEEIRKRLIISILSIFMAALASYYFAEDIRNILLIPAGNIRLIYTNPMEAFMSNVRVAFMCGIIVAMPILIYQFLAYILPALYKNEKKFILPLVFSMLIMFILGILFSYKVAYPFTIEFFLQYSSDNLEPMFTITEYINFVSRFLLTFGMIFQLPLLFTILGYANIVTAKMLSKFRRYIIVILGILAAIITPPDVVSQIMVLIPLCFLYEIGIVLVRVVQFWKEDTI